MIESFWSLDGFMSFCDSEFELANEGVGTAAHAVTNFIIKIFDYIIAGFQNLITKLSTLKEISVGANYIKGLDVCNREICALMNKALDAFVTGKDSAEEYRQELADIQDKFRETKKYKNEAPLRTLDSSQKKKMANNIKTGREYVIKGREYARKAEFVGDMKAKNMAMVIQAIANQVIVIGTDILSNSDHDKNGAAKKDSRIELSTPIVARV